MPAQYRISEQDYVDAMRLFARPGARSISILAAIALAAIALALFGPPLVRAGAIGGLVGIAVVAAGSFALLPWTARRHYRKYRAIHETFTVELLENGVRFASRNGEGTLAWAHVLKWRQNDRFVLLYPMPRLFHIVPRAIASQGFDVEALVDRLRRHVGAAA
ncbi:YcxB family protein [Luteimonas aquatica]|uniref:YcxB family protein n=1 Tax=Luteimonas aquatica TaxID=450364 RepID=UPI001F5A8495|nr:YcxB family protein [Luteimonas aquatica]